MKKTKEEIGKEAAEYARKKLFADCKAVKLTPRRVLKRIAESLDAIENSVFYDKDRGKCVVGPDMINYRARAKAIDQSVAIFGMNAPEKHDVTVDGIESILKALDGQKNS